MGERASGGEIGKAGNDTLFGQMPKTIEREKEASGGGGDGGGDGKGDAGRKEWWKRGVMWQKSGAEGE